MAKLTFYGGAKSVTGANYLFEYEGTKILIDCGLLQGSQLAEDFNYKKFPYTPEEINYVLITHSHADHVGRTPKLYKEGFRGKFICTNPTLEIIRRALPDNMNLLTEEAVNHGHEPLWDENDLNNLLSLAEPVDYEEEKDLGSVKVVFHDAGHILGSSIIEIQFDTKKIYFSGDLGNPPTPLLNYPFMPKDGDYVVIESAYGGRVHEDRAVRKDILRNAIASTVEKGGTIMIPSFAIERTQELLYELNNLFNDKKIPTVPIFVDSPLATKMTEVYRQFPNYFNNNSNYIIKSGDDVFDFPGLKFTQTVEESKSINDVAGSKIIIAGSGMSNGGRILHHERRYLSDPNSAIIFVGYQVQGSLGRKILDGEKRVKVLGDKVEVNCSVVAIGGYSAHADQNMLVKWAGSSVEGGRLKKVFIVQGEENSASVLAQKIKNESGIEAIVPSENEVFEI
jgi:metallo-beta-lactamase family protein